MRGLQGLGASRIDPWEVQEGIQRQLQGLQDGRRSYMCIDLAAGTSLRCVPGQGIAGFRVDLVGGESTADGVAKLVEPVQRA